ncbi:hypothetical protein LguiA_002271 [Lonicera macranthoides]
MSVTEYEAKFENLSRFEKGLDSDLVEKIHLFLKGLRPSIRENVYHLTYSSVTEAVRIAMKVKQERADASRFLERKRGIEQNKSGNQGKKYRSDYGSSSGSVGSGRFSGSTSEYQGSKERVCYGSGQPEHICRDCLGVSREQQPPQPPYRQSRTQGSDRDRTSGRVYTLSQVEQPEAKVMEVSEVASSLDVAPALREKKDYSILDEDVYDFCETFDNREMEGSSTILLDIAYTDSSSSIVLKPLPPNSPL